MSKRINAKNIAYFSIILILVLVMLFSGLQILESTVFSGEQGEETMPASKKITRDGVDYFPRQDITVVMVMGIDKYGPVAHSGSYNNTGAADMVALLIFDEKIMQFTMGNAITIEDTNGNKKLLKKRYEAKIDNVSAMMDAFVAYKLNRDAFE